MSVNDTRHVGRVNDMTLPYGARRKYTACRVKGLPLHREVSKVLDPRRALRELRKVKRAMGGRADMGVRPRPDGGSTLLIGAFAWMHSPQGHEYWDALHWRLVGQHSHK